MTKVAIAKGYCMDYGPCEHHAPVRIGALSENDGKSVPVYFKSSNHYYPDGIARLTCDDKGVFADVKITNSSVVADIEKLKNPIWRFGSMVNNVKKRKRRSNKRKSTIR